MEQTDDQQVVLDQNGGGVSEGTTTTPAGVSHGETTGAGGNDALEALIAAKTKEIEASLRKEYEGHVGKVKSTLQSQLDRANRELQEQQRKWQSELRQIKMQGMDEPARKQLEEEIRQEEITRRDREIAELRQQQSELQAAQQYVEFFAELGVPQEKLNRSGKLEDLVNSGYDALRAMISELRSSSAAPKATKAKGEDAPPVVTQTSPAPSGSTWKDLITKYGSMDAVFSLVETGQLPPSILPTS